MASDFFKDLRHFVMREIVEKYRLGTYVGKIGAAYDAFGRADVIPEWMQDPYTAVRVVTVPIMDVKPKSGSNVAVVSQDGVPSHPLNFGVIYDGSFTLADQTVWVRADLDGQPGQLELGATQAVQVNVGPKADSLAPLAAGKVSIGNGTGEIVADLSEVCSQLSQAVGRLQTMTTAISTAAGAVVAGTPAEVVTYTKAVAAAMQAATLAPVAQSLAQLQVKIDTMKV